MILIQGVDYIEKYITDSQDVSRKLNHCSAHLCACTGGLSGDQAFRKRPKNTRYTSGCRKLPESELYETKIIHRALFQKSEQYVFREKRGYSTPLPLQCRQVQKTQLTITVFYPTQDQKRQFSKTFDDLFHTKCFEKDKISKNIL